MCADLHFRGRGTHDGPKERLRMEEGVDAVNVPSGFTAVKTQKPTSHPAVSALKICISSKRLRSEVRKKALLEIQ